MPARVLAIFAHPDDETFLAGGTLARLARAGAEVRLLTLTRGEAGRRGEYEKLPPAQFAAVRRQELEDACRALGIRRPLVGGCPDGRVATDCREIAERGIRGSLRRLRPDLVITLGPDGVSGHRDHVSVSEITTSAFLEAFPAGDGGSREPRLYYALRSGATPACCAPAVRRAAPPVTAVIEMEMAAGERKLAAVRCHRSQRHLQPADASSQAMIAAAAERFHRAFPPWSGGPIETDLDDLLPALRRAARSGRGHVEAIR